ncbi:Protein kinase domain/Protein tyrosine kinase, putative [Angomonas deanei]|uniref:Protein kinase domain/Protein tyrosine kinase, putative n=1 Tax=Angomonas deanei TaxID=59799 RepID=A0A7G2CDR7_9TRYP|nr:Protein kinase domain/Protein tyrosine kinase, putative [Angomonas deanei]
MTDKELSFSLFSENKKRSYCAAIVRQLGEALSFLHEEAGAVHGDLSLRNILIRLPDENNNNNNNSSTIEVKLIDWENGFLSNNNNDNSIIGRSDTTTLYGPPERLLHLNDNHHNGLTSVDVWALGIIVFQLYTEKVNVYPLFDIVDSNNMFQFMSDLSAFVHSSHAIENVIQQQIMHYDKKNKDSTRVISFITKCLQIDPNNRSSVEELMKEENFPFF